MRKPFIYSDAVPGLSAGEYDTFVASWRERGHPVYMVINRTSGVVEFFSENKTWAKEWLQHFSSDVVESTPDFEKLVAAEAAKKAN